MYITFAWISISKWSTEQREDTQHQSLLENNINYDQLIKTVFSVQLGIYIPNNLLT